MKVLVADDDAVTRHLLSATLAQLGHDPVLCHDGTAALNALTAAEPPQLAILDWGMPGLDGLAVCRAIRKASPSYVYVIMVSARDTRADIIEALESEVDDYLSKPLDLIELRLRLRAGERVLAVQDHLLSIQTALTYQATHDALTGLMNRGAIVEQLERELNRARRGAAPLGVMIADLDHFKAINDRYGHQVGDAVLREAGARMKDALRSCDIIGRYGGEEFLIVTPDSDPAGVLMAAERVRMSLAAAPMHVNHEQVAMTLSIGVACSHRGVDRPGDLIKAADMALYQAKHSGRNVVAPALLIDTAPSVAVG
jgi:diguanylate cyclase (GGDEF)-like protein